VPRAPLVVTLCIRPIEKARLVTVPLVSTCGFAVPALIRVLIGI